MTIKKQEHMDCLAFCGLELGAGNRQALELAYLIGQRPGDLRNIKSKMRIP
ncbi:MAG: hypothetical protein LBB76_01715 [Azoarcus sp.]|jgi:hypothetical protein|nr:hypothetical protein [Azoarcus sp.]